MSTTDPTSSTRTVAEVRGRTSDSFVARRQLEETKASFLTTELWLTLAGVAALIVVYNVADNTENFDLWDTALLCTILGAAYLLSRGLAKSGSPKASWSEDRMDNRMGDRMGERAADRY